MARVWLIDSNHDNLLAALIVRGHHVNRARTDPAQNQSTWVWLVFRVFLNHLAALEHPENVNFAEPSMEHPLNGMNPEHQRRVTRGFLCFRTRIGHLLA